MRRLSVWALAGAVVLLGSVPRARAEGNDLTGQRAPEINVQEGLQGLATGTTLASCRGQVVVLKFWFTRCSACRKSLPEFQALYQRYAPRGVQFVALAYDQTSRVVPFLRSGGFTFPVAIDSSGVTSTRYGVSTYPTTYVIGADGIVKAYDQLSAPLLERELEAARSATRPGGGRRPLLTFPRPSAAATVPASEATGAHAAAAALASAPAPATLRSEPLPADPDLVAAEPATATLASAPLQSVPPAQPVTRERAAEPVIPAPVPAVAAAAAAPPVAPSSLSGAAAAIEVRDFPAALRAIEAYASTRTSPAAWRPSELDEARRLEGLVRDAYLLRHEAIGAQWQRHELEPAISAARALAADYRGTSLERVAATLAQWYESHVPTAAVAR